MMLRSGEETQEVKRLSSSAEMTLAICSVCSAKTAAPIPYKVVDIRVLVQKSLKARRQGTAVYNTEFTRSSRLSTTAGLQEMEAS